MRMGKKEAQSTALAAVLVPRVLNECQQSQASHPRAIKQLAECRKNGSAEFLEVWMRCLQPLFLVSKREPAAERIVNFAAAFAAYWDEEFAKDCEIFFEAFLSTLVVWAKATHKTVRFRACQMISEAISKLATNFDVSDELWDRMTSTMQTRMQDRQTSVRVFAASALSRLVNPEDIPNDPTVHAYRKALTSDPSAEVRKMVVKSMPAANSTVSDVVQRIADVSESVRKASYQTIGERFNASGLSITQRAMIVERGLAERVPAVRAECEKLLELWLREDCDGDPLILLRYLDVETYEKVGETTILELLSKNLIKFSDTGLRQFLGTSGDEPQGNRIMNAEEALFWRVLCSHIHSEAKRGARLEGSQRKLEEMLASACEACSLKLFCNSVSVSARKAKGCEAATTGGAEAAVNAAVAAEQNEYLERILPPTMADFVRLIEAHLHKGSVPWFSARQLLLLARLMDFTDSTSRKDAGVLLQRLLRETEPSEGQGDSDNCSSQEWVGDGLSLGGEESWAIAVADLARHVHASSGEFEEVLAAAVAEVGRPCREGGADVRHWLHCLAVTGLLLENITSLDVLAGRAIEPEEIVHSLLLPAVKHLHSEVQRAGVRCLGIFCGLERSPSPRAVEQLRLSLHSARPEVQRMALKAMFDLILCHGAAAIDRAAGMVPDLGLPTPHARPPGAHIPDFNSAGAQHMEDSETRRTKLPLLELLVECLYGEALMEDVQDGTVYVNYATNIAAEGFAKVLLQNKRFPDILLMQETIVEELVILYFSDSSAHSSRLKQCLAVFFRIWCSLSADNKRSLSKVFVPVMRKKWPGIYENREKPGTVLVARKHATQVAHFMLHLLHLPLIAKGTEGQNQKSPNCGDESVICDDDACSAPECEDAPDEGHESLGIQICAEVGTLKSRCGQGAGQKVQVLVHGRKGLYLDALQSSHLTALQSMSAGEDQGATVLDSTVNYSGIRDKIRCVPPGRFFTYSGERRRRESLNVHDFFHFLKFRMCRVIEWLPAAEKTLLKVFPFIEVQDVLRISCRVIEWLPAAEKTSLKALREALARLKELDRSPDQGLTDEELELFMVRMGFHDYFKEESSPENPSTPEPPSVVRTGGRRVSVASRTSAIAQTSVPASTRSRRKITEMQTVRSQTAAARRRVIAMNTARKNLNSVYESTSDESDSSTISSASESDISDTEQV